MRVQDLVSLLNTVIEPTGKTADIDLYGDVLSDLARQNYVVIGYDDKDRAHEDLDEVQTIEFLGLLVSEL